MGTLYTPGCATLQEDDVAGSISGIPMSRSFPDLSVITDILISGIWKKKHGAKGCARKAWTTSHAVFG